MKRVVTFTAIALSAVVLAATPDASLVQTSGEPAVAAGRFYGYRTKSEGPGDDALAKAQALAAAEHVPLVVVWSEEDCEHCNDFIAQMNAANDDVASFLSTNRAVFTFFKADTTDNNVPTITYKPKVVYDAYEHSLSLASISKRPTERSPKEVLPTGRVAAAGRDSKSFTWTGWQRTTSGSTISAANSPRPARHTTATRLGSRRSGSTWN